MKKIDTYTFVMSCLILSVLAICIIVNDATKPIRRKLIKHKYYGR